MITAQSQIWMHGWESTLFTHLWQSTAIAVVAWLLTVALQNNSARIRYVIWLCASIKFLIPFRLLTDFGAHWAKPVPSAQPGFSIFVEQFDLQFRQVQLHQAQLPSAALPAAVPSLHFIPILWAVAATLWLCGCIVLVARWVSDWRRAGALVRASQPAEAGREFNALQCALRRAHFQKPIRLRLSSSEIEPGVFGVFRPALLWPANLSGRLDDAQIQAIMTHEIEHVRHHDNLTCAIHALVEALFWFHPLVRWMSNRMTEERERACDERVMQSNARPEAYAESILMVCSFCLEPPTACASGVSGADLKERIQRIITQRRSVALSAGRKLVLFAAVILTVAFPIGFGVLHGQTSPKTTAPTTQGSVSSADLPKYDVASIKSYKADDGPNTRLMIRILPDGVSLQGMPMRMLLQQSFGVERDRIIGEPAWARSARFDIEAKVDPEEAPKLRNLKMDQRNAMMLQLLVDRFNLKYHHETRELPMYALVVAKGGPKLTESNPGEGMPGPGEPVPGAQPGGALPPPGAPGPMVKPDRPPGSGDREIVGEGMRMRPGSIDSHGASIDFLAHSLSGMLGRTVIDKTGLTGRYDFSLNWTPDESMRNVLGDPAGGTPEAAPDAGGPTLFTALEEQLGLKLESEKAKVDVIVIDSVDQPTRN